jgi:glutaredoxin
MSWNCLKFWRPQQEKCKEWNVVMYTRQGCHLCEQAWQQLEQAQKRYHFALSQVDVDEDAQLAREYGECVPVVVVNGRVRFRGIVNPVLLRRLLEAGYDHI